MPHVPHYREDPAAMAVRTLWPQSTSSPRENTGWLSLGAGTGGRSLQARERTGRGRLALRAPGTGPQLFSSRSGQPSVQRQCFLHVPSAGSVAGKPALARRAWPGPWALPSGCAIPLWSPGLPTAAAVPGERPASVLGAGLQKSPQTQLQLYVFK